MLHLTACFFSFFNSHKVEASIFMASVAYVQSLVEVCDPMGCSLPGSFAHGIFQARILEWVAIPSPGDLLNPGNEPASLASPALAGGFFATEPPNCILVAFQNSDSASPQSTLFFIPTLTSGLTHPFDLSGGYRRYNMNTTHTKFSS